MQEVNGPSLRCKDTDRAQDGLCVLFGSDATAEEHDRLVHWQPEPRSNGRLRLMRWTENIAVNAVHRNDVDRLPRAVAANDRRKIRAQHDVTLADPCIEHAEDADGRVLDAAERPSVGRGLPAAVIGLDRTAYQHQNRAAHDPAGQICACRSRAVSLYDDDVDMIAQCNQPADDE